MKYCFIVALLLFLGCGSVAQDPDRTANPTSTVLTRDVVQPAEWLHGEVQLSAIERFHIYSIIEAFLVGVHQASKYVPSLVPLIGRENPHEVVSRLHSAVLIVFQSPLEAASYSEWFAADSLESAQSLTQLWKCSKVVLRSKNVASVFLETSTANSYSLLELSFHRATAWELRNVETLINAP